MNKSWDEMTDKEKVLGMVDDLVNDFMCYDRKDDEDFPRGKIEELIDNGIMKREEIVEQFRSALAQWFNLDQPKS